MVMASGVSTSDGSWASAAGARRARVLPLRPDGGMMVLPMEMSTDKICKRVRRPQRRQLSRPVLLFQVCQTSAITSTVGAHLANENSCFVSKPLPNNRQQAHDFKQDFACAARQGKECRNDSP